MLQGLSINLLQIMVHATSSASLFDLCINYWFRINNSCKNASYWNGLLRVPKPEKDSLTTEVYLLHDPLIKEFNCNSRFLLFFWKIFFMANQHKIPFLYHQPKCHYNFMAMWFCIQSERYQSYSGNISTPLNKSEFLNSPNWSIYVCIGTHACIGTHIIAIQILNLLLYDKLFSVLCTCLLVQHFV